MESWLAELIKGGSFVAVLAYVWHDAKARMEKAAENFERSLAAKADKESTAELKHDLMRHVERLEERQTRDVEAMRAEIGKMNVRLDTMQANMSDGFNQVIALLVKK